MTKDYPQERKICPCCGHIMRHSYSLEGIPAQSTLLLDSADAALAFPRANLDLFVCTACGFAANLSYEEALVDYSSGYQDSQLNSATFRRYAGELLADWDKRYGVRQQSVVEIGCGQGDFLRLAAEEYEISGTGLDPALGVSANEGALEFRAETFDPGTVEGPVDYILCRHTLEHVTDVRGLLGQVLDLCRESPEAIVLFEVPDFDRILTEAAYWDVYHEHCSYFSAPALQALFRSVGFKVLRLSRTYNDQYLVIEARLEESAESDRSKLVPSCYAKLTEEFSDACVRKIEYWRDWLEEANNADQRVSLWGSGSKAVSFMSGCFNEAVQNVVDINPARQGHFMPGFPTPIVAPESLVEQRPDHVLIMNPIYRDEIRDQLMALDIDCGIEVCS